MADFAVETVIALAKAGIECCRTAKIYQEEAVRIGQRLTIIVAETHKWAHLYQGNNVRGLGQFHDAVEKIFLCMQAASLGRNGSWKARMMAKMGSEGLLQNIREAENELNVIISGLHIEQSNAIYERLGSLDDVRNDLDDVKKGVAQVAQLLDRFGMQMMQSGGEPMTIQQKVDAVLRECQQQTPEIAIFSASATETAADSSCIAADLPVEVDVEPPLPWLQPVKPVRKSEPPLPWLQPVKPVQRCASKVVFEPSHNDLKAITLKNSAIVFNRDDLLGSGGFAEVFRGTYKCQPVAIKRLKVESRVMSLLKEDEIQRDIDRLAAETLMMRRCSTHPNIIEVIGCTTSFNEADRPMIVMELMHMTLF